MPAAEDLVMMEMKQRLSKKASKPLMEKRRRARINHCLSQLKALVVDKNHNENSRQTKLEKADILELTVRYLYDLKRRQRSGSASNDPHIKQRYEMGFAECAKEVEVFLSNCGQPSIQPEVQRRLRCHLLNRVKSIHQTVPNDDQVAKTEVQAPGEAPGKAASETSSSEEVTLIPKRLPNGDLALVIPPNVLANGSAISCPMSAFRLICNQWPQIEGDSGNKPDNYKWKKRLCNWSPSSPPSSSASDVSAEECDELHRNRFNDPTDNSNPSVWRPW